jgi:pre-mRNA cleavage complex 2 protein Pcf11
VAPEAGATAGDVAAARPAELQYIPVPEDPRVNTICPICQEKFEMKWLDEAQEWVWTDAVKVGGRVYHASCHAEATRDRGSTPGGQARNTPEPILGKRKAEVSCPSPVYLGSRHHNMLRLTTSVSEAGWPFGERQVQT